MRFRSYALSLKSPLPSQPQQSAAASSPRTASGALPSWREIVLLTLPQVGLMLCHLAISLTDLWVAGRLDAGVQASLGVVTQIFALLMLVTSLAGAGCMATVSQSLGAGLPRRASRYAGLIVSLALASGTCVGLTGLLLRGPALTLMGISPDMRPVITTFITAYCCQLPLYYALIMLNSIFRAYKLMRLPLIALALTAGGNCAGSLGFGLGMWGLPDCGYAGVAWSTFGSAVLGFSCNLFAALRHGILGPRAFAPWRWNRLALPYLFRVGVPATVGQIASQAGSLVTLGILGALPGNPVAVVAGMTLGARVQSVLLFPIAALGMTMTVFSGHLLGAGRRDGLYRLAVRVALCTAAVLVIPALLLYLFRVPVAGLMTEDGDVLRQAAAYLPFACLAVPLSGASVVLNGVFAGAGATRLTCLIGCVTTWALGIPLGYGLAALFDAPGVYAAGLFAQFAGFIWLTALFRSKKWLEYGLRKRQNG